MSKIINLFGGPGIGKSSIAAGLTYKLKKKHIKVDNPYEFPKQLAWDENHLAIRDQLYVLANQHRGIVKSFGKVDFIILDSPILLSLVYRNEYSGNTYPSNLYTQSFDNLVLDIFNQYDNFNIVLERTDGEYNDKERYQSIEQSLVLDKKIENVLITNNMSYHKVKVNEESVNYILDILNI